MFDWTMTLAQLLAWVVSTGVALAVAYVVAQLPIPDAYKTIVSHIANAVLAAFVTAVAQLIPQTYLDATLWNLLILVFSFVVNWAATFVGQTRGFNAKAKRAVAERDMLGAVADLKYVKVNSGK